MTDTERATAKVLEKYNISLYAPLPESLERNLDELPPYPFSNVLQHKQNQSKKPSTWLEIAAVVMMSAAITLTAVAIVTLIIAYFSE